MIESILNHDWGEVALGNTPKIKGTLQSHVTKQGNIKYVHALIIRKGRDTWTTIETLPVASSLIRDSKDDAYSAVITKINYREGNQEAYMICHF